MTWTVKPAHNQARFRFHDILKSNLVADMQELCMQSPTVPILQPASLVRSQYARDAHVFPTISAGTVHMQCECPLPDT
jgi:hypothetical protein